MANIPNLKVDKLVRPIRYCHPSILPGPDFSTGLSQMVENGLVYIERPGLKTLAALSDFADHSLIHFQNTER